MLCPAFSSIFLCLASRCLAFSGVVKVEHDGKTNTLPLVCGATLVERKSSGDGYIECSVLIKRTGNLQYVSHSKTKGSRARSIRQQVTTIVSFIMLNCVREYNFNFVI